jgi:hypothetical protein
MKDVLIRLLLIEVLQVTNHRWIQELMKRTSINSSQHVPLGTGLDVALTHAHQRGQG